VRHSVGPEPLLLDEMFAPGLAAALCAQSFDVLAVAGHPTLAGASDEQVSSWAAERGRRVVTENVRDFAPLAGQGDPAVRLLFTSSRRFPRTRRNPAPLIEALCRWLEASAAHPDVDWLR
jgi:hypothetical protein